MSGDFWLSSDEYWLSSYLLKMYFSSFQNSGEMTEKNHKI